VKFSILASGSSGNAIYVESPQARILLDAGISGKQLEARLRAVADVSLSQLDAILITHEHIDHVRGLPQAAKLSSASLYLTEGTWEQVASKLPEPVGGTARMRQVTAGTAFTVADITITPFTVSHDAEEPVAYRFDCNGTRLTVLTDLGYVSDQIKGIAYGSNAIVLETNHDVNMLRAGRYPWNLKRRILGDKGHLSNEDAAVALADLLATEEVAVYMAHLSEENNQPDLAQITVESVLREVKQSALEQVKLRHTSRIEPTSLCSL
jgi:phosphoribosyl 1,2-cyclic phosphodiesterase